MNGEATTLSSNLLDVAKEELGEDDSSRRQALIQFIQWIQKNPDLKNCRTDPNFLLRFLRTNKFSLPMAQMMLLKYLNLRQTFSKFFYGLDYLQPSLLELIDSGYLFPSPVRDKNGRRVIIGIAANFDPYKFTCNDMARIHGLTYETLLEDEEDQVLGYTHIGDFKGLSAAFVTLWSPSEFTKVFRRGEQSLPMRHKEIHLLNLSPPFKFIVDFVTSIVSEKLKERIKSHSNTEDLLSALGDRSVLPKEYGGYMPMSQMIELWKRELSKKREKLVALDKMELLNSSCLKKNQKNIKKNLLNDMPVVGSFKKLEID